MVRGLNIFKEYFRQYSHNYVIIGGTACDIIIVEAGFTPRTTKDIDIILVVEALSSEFVEQFWKFIKTGEYGDREQSIGKRQYYRFRKPKNTDFPYQIELFSRIPDVIAMDRKVHLTPIPVDDDLSSLSAILLNDDYYNYVIEHSVEKDGLKHASIDALICLKAKAFLEIMGRIESGSHEDKKQLRKHKTDVFRLTVMLTPDAVFDLPHTIQAHIYQFADIIANDLPDKAIFKEMGLGNTEPKAVFEQFKKSFRIS
ncbi:MAG TPA: hypothetical protein PKL52_03435 [Tenuifilaceae bacterium]|nr:hypothetical protein [Tenuifilaceae bacterium]